MRDYTPRPDAADLLKKALEIIESVPYSVTSRWAFYQMVQSFGLGKDAYSRFLSLTSKARKRFWGGWTPKTLADDTRATSHVLVCGGRFLRHSFGEKGWGKTCRFCGAPNPILDGKEPTA